MKNTTLQTESNDASRPHRSKLVWAMVILILVPAITAIGFMAVLMNTEINSKSEAGYVSDISSYMSVSNLLIHELQKERGLSYVFGGVNGEEMVSNLSAQRLLTNQKLAALNAHMKSFDVEHYGQRLVFQLSLFQKKITDLPAIRNKIDSASITRNETIEYYSEVIENIIRTFQSFNNSIRDTEHSVLFTACINLIMAKEMAGIERAIMTGIVSEDKPVLEFITAENTFSDSEMHRWMRVLKGQDALFSAYSHQASEETLKKFNNMLTSANTKAVEDIRNQIYKKHDEGGYELSPSFVFAVTTQRIDELRGVVDVQILEILQVAERISSVANSSLITYATLIGISIIIMCTLCFLIARSITRPITTLTNEVRRVAEGDFEHEFEIKSNNEIGDLSGSFKLMRVVLKENMSKREEAEKEMESLNKSLEQRVEERTAELEKVNEELLSEINERMKTEKSLLESERRYWTLVESAPIAIYETDAQGSCIFVNKKWRELTGLKLEEALGDGWQEGLHKEDRTRVFKQWHEHMRDIKPWNMDYRFCTSDGEVSWLMAKAVALRDTDGLVTGYLGANVDITERVRMQDELVKLQKLESVGVLAGGIAHDFNNSLQGILSTISMAKLHINPEDDAYNELTNAEKVIIQSRGLSQQLLTFSKGGDPIKKVISASVLIKESANLALSGSNVICELEVPDCGCMVEADEGQINQVFNNLFINADQVMPDGGVIKVGVDHFDVEEKDSLPLQEGMYVKVTISDQGTGITQEHLQKIFDPYFTTKETGSGLGLATAFSIIKKHDGYITVESELGAGTTFHIYLPVSQKKAQQEPILDKAKVSSVEETSIICKGKILIMDDDDVIRLVTTQILKNIKYEVEAARDGAEAIELYKKAFDSTKSFDAIIMDLTIPGGMGGKEAVKKLLEIDPKAKAIVSSGYANDPILSDFKEYGFRDVLNKPYEIDELNEILQKVITENEEC